MSAGGFAENPDRYRPEATSEPRTLRGSYPTPANGCANGKGNRYLAMSGNSQELERSRVMALAQHDWKLLVYPKRRYSASNSTPKCPGNWSSSIGPTVYRCDSADRTENPLTSSVVRMPPLTPTATF